MKKIISGIKKIINNFTENETKKGHNYLQEFIDSTNRIYNDFCLRIDDKNWSTLIKEASSELDEETVSNELLKFLVEHRNLPYQVWCELDKSFSWSSKSEELSSSFSAEFIQYVLANINNEYRLNYHLFNENIKGSYDEFIDLYYKAYFDLREKRLYGADKCIKQAKEIFDGHLDLIVLEANYYAELNRVEEAVERLTHVINLDENYSAAYFDRANIFLRIGKLKEAYEDYHKCLSLDPSNIAAQYELAGCTLNLGYYEESRELYNKLLSMHPNHKEITVNLNSANNFIIDELEEKIASSSCTDSEKYSLAKSYYYFNEYEKCLELISDIENSMEDNAELYLLAGECLTNLNQGEKAERYFDKAIKLEPDNYKNYHGKGHLFYQLEEVEKALECFNKVIELEPRFVKVYLSKAMCLKSLRKYKEAIEECNKYIDMDNNDGQSLYLKGQCLMKIGNYEEAIRYYDKAVEIMGSSQEMCYMKGLALQLLGNYRDAFQYYQWCLEYTDDGSKGYNRILVEANYNMGLALLESQNPEESYEYFQKAIEENSEFLPAYGGKLLWLLQEKNYDKCIKTCAEGLKIRKIDIKNYTKEDIINQFKIKFKNYKNKLDIEKIYKKIIKALDEIAIN